MEIGNPISISRVSPPNSKTQGNREGRREKVEGNIKSNRETGAGAGKGELSRKGRRKKGKIGGANILVFENWRRVSLGAPC